MTCRSWTLRTVQLGHHLRCSGRESIGLTFVGGCMGSLMRATRRWRRWRLHWLQAARILGDSTCLRLASFRGVRRRQDVLYASRRRVVLEDFAHHPTAVAGAISALKAAYPDLPMTVCFEPRAIRRLRLSFSVSLPMRWSRRTVCALERCIARIEWRRMRDWTRLRWRSSCNRRGRVARAFEDNAQLLAYFEGDIRERREGVLVFFLPTAPSMVCLKKPLPLRTAALESRAVWLEAQASSGPRRVLP